MFPLYECKLKFLVVHELKNWIGHQQWYCSYTSLTSCEIIYLFSSAEAYITYNMNHDTIAMFHVPIDYGK